MTTRRRRGFTLIEILVVVAILGLLVAVLMPSLARARQHSKRTACAGNLRQIATATMSYRQQNQERFPTACAIPEPIGKPGIPDPPLYEALRNEVKPKSRVYACPGDRDYVHARCGISYLYDTNLSGLRVEDTPYHRLLKLKVEDIPVAFDMDGFADEASGMIVPFFHLRRNLLFADGHVGEYRARPTNPNPPPAPTK